MKLHIFVLSLTLAATAAHADLFDKLKKIEEDVSELKETIEEIGGDEDEAEAETPDKTTVLENSASAAQQGVAANTPSENKPSSKPGNAGSSTGQNMVEDFAKANVTYTEVRGFFHERVVNTAIRADSLAPPIVPPETIIRPEEYECTLYRWASADAARAWYEEWKQSGHPRPNVFRMEFVGVRPVDEIGRCEFDTMNIVANEANAPVAISGAQTAQSDDVEQSTGDTPQTELAEDGEVLDPKAMLDECGRLGHRICQRVCFRAASLKRSSDVEDCRAAYNKVKAQN